MSSKIDIRRTLSPSSKTLLDRVDGQGRWPRQSDAPLAHRSMALSWVQELMVVAGTFWTHEVGDSRKASRRTERDSWAKHRATVFVSPRPARGPWPLKPGFGCKAPGPVLETGTHEQTESNGPMGQYSTLKEMQVLHR